MTRRIRVFAALALCALTLAACGSSGGAAPAPGNWNELVWNESNWLEGN